MTSNLVEVSKDGEIAVITINNPPVNALSPGVPEGIAEAIEIVAADRQVKAAVLMGAGKTFVAGADIKEFGKITSGERRGSELVELLLKMEDCPKPLVAAIHGTAFGGGLELAMAAHYRVANPGAQVGQHSACRALPALRKPWRCARRAILSKPATRWRGASWIG